MEANCHIWFFGSPGLSHRRLSYLRFIGSLVSQTLIISLLSWFRRLVSQTLIISLLSWFRPARLTDAYHISVVLVSPGLSHRRLSYLCCLGFAGLSHGRLSYLWFLVRPARLTEFVITHHAKCEDFCSEDIFWFQSY